MARSELRSVGGTLTDLHRVLEGWCDLQSKYSQIDFEPAYDHTEAANTSFLVSAANAIHGWTGVAESCVPWKLDAEGSKKHRGRLDAYIAIEDHGYVIELKQVWMTGKDETEIPSHNYSRKLSRAEKQIKELDFKGSDFGNDCTFLFGTYLVPDYDPAKYKLKRKVLFRKFVQHYESIFDAFAVFSSALTNKEATREHDYKQKWRRPIVALGLNEQTAAKRSC